MRLPEESKPVLSTSDDTTPSPASASTVVLDSASVPDVTEDPASLLDDVNDAQLESEIPAAPTETVPSICGRQRKTATVLSSGHRLQYRHRRSTRRHGMASNGSGCGINDPANSTPNSGILIRW